MFNLVRYTAATDGRHYGRVWAYGNDPNPLGASGPRACKIPLGHTVGGILSRSTIKIGFLIISGFNMVWGGFGVGSESA